MSTLSMAERTLERSPRFKARMAGIFYLLTIATGVLSLVIDNKLVTTGDPAATAASIVGHEPLYRLSVVAGLLATASYIAVTLLLYDLFKPVNKSLSLLAAFFSLVGCGAGAASSMFHLAPLVVLGGASYLSVFQVEQLQVLAFVFLKLGGQAYDVGMVFFGFYCSFIGYLTFRSSFLPRIVGVLMMVAGLSWLTFLYRPLANQLLPYISILGFLGEASLTIWLLLVGVNVRKWEQKAGRIE